MEHQNYSQTELIHAAPRGLQNTAPLEPPKLVENTNCVVFLCQNVAVSTEGPQLTPPLRHLVLGSPQNFPCNPPNPRSTAAKRPEDTAPAGCRSDFNPQRFLSIKS